MMCMKPFLVILGTLVATFNSPVQARVITLTANYQTTSNELAVATNEVACVSSWQTHYPQGTKLQVVKNGITVEIPGRNGNGDTIVPQIKIAGPATVRLITFGEPGPSVFCTIDIAPQSFPPDKSIIIPADTNGANIIMEASPDLIHWTNAPPGFYTNNVGNMFFRLRAERIP